MGRVIGIDLGTTNSCAAVVEGGSPVVIPNAEGGRTTPSVVAFGKTGERIVGEAARRQAAVNVDRTISSIKREMGSDYKKLIDGKFYNPQEISAMILRKLKKDAEAYLGQSVNEAVITVPAYFNDAQRQATKDAGRIAGLNVLRIINEPTSAALSYGLDHGDPRKILVYDLGGGTFDVSVIEIGDNLIEVLATAGNNHLGGDDFDRVLTEYILEEFRRKEGVDLHRDSAALQRVRDEAEKIKKELSTAAQAVVNLPFIAVGNNGPMHLEVPVTRAKFEELIRSLVDQTEEPVRQALGDAGLMPSALDMVLLVGGSTRIPMVQEKVRRICGREPARNINPDECVAMGAAIQGEKLSGSSTALTNPAMNSLILMDVTPLSLSIETVGGISTRLIERNTTIPARYSQIFSTAANFQTSVDIHVLQGERYYARDNKLIGTFRLGGIKRAMAGVPQIEVTFDIDVNGILKVSARDLGTGRAQEITITASNNMSEDEIRRAEEDARRYESEDGKRREAGTLVNDASATLRRVQLALGDKNTRNALPKDQRKRIENDEKALEKALRKRRADDISPAVLDEIRRLEQNLKDSAGGIL